MQAAAVKGFTQVVTPALFGEDRRRDENTSVAQFVAERIALPSEPLDVVDAPLEIVDQKMSEPQPPHSR